MEAIGGACQGLKIVGDIYAYMNKEISVRSRNVVAKKLLKITKNTRMSLQKFIKNT